MQRCLVVSTPTTQALAWGGLGSALVSDSLLAQIFADHQHVLLYGCNCQEGGRLRVEDSASA